MPRALLPESPGFSYAGVFWFGFIPDKFSPGLRTLYARGYSGISKISQFRQNTPVQKYFLTWIEKPRPANVFSRFLWRVFSDGAGPVFTQFDDSRFTLRWDPCIFRSGVLHARVPPGLRTPGISPALCSNIFFGRRVFWCTIHRKLQHTPAYNWGVLALPPHKSSTPPQHPQGLFCCLGISTFSLAPGHALFDYIPIQRHFFDQ